MKHKNIDILKLLQINRQLKESITSQLEKALENIIRNMTPEEQLPSEREIANGLKISRVTVRNVMKKLKERKLLAVYGRSGTYVSEKSVSAQLEGIHPIAFSNFAKRYTHQVLNLLLYENIPFQKVFWENAVNEYNSQTRCSQIEIKWLPLSVSTEANYSDYFLESNNIDIFQFSLNRTISSLAAALPTDIQKEFYNGEYFSDIILPEIKDVLQFIMPLSFNMIMTLWNDMLAKQTGLKDVRLRICNGEINEMLAEASGKLPADTKAYGHIWDRLICMGKPLQSTDITVDLFREMLSTIPIVSQYGSVYIYEQRYPFEAPEMFYNGKLIFLEGVSSGIFIYGKKLSQGISCTSNFTKNEKIIPSVALGLAISKHSTNYESALDFIRFMSSPRIQELEASCKLTIPFFKKALSGITTATNGQISEEVLSSQIKNYRIFDNVTTDKHSIWNDVIIFAARNILIEYCKGSINIDEASRKIFAIWQNNQKGPIL